MCRLGASFTEDDDRGLTVLGGWAGNGGVGDDYGGGLRPHGKSPIVTARVILRSKSDGKETVHSSMNGLKPLRM